MEPFHRRLAEIYGEAQGNPNRMKFSHLMEALHAHYRWALKLDKYKKMADLARRLGDEEFEKEVCEQIDQHLQKTLS